jgi:hypothetical protein
VILGKLLRKGSVSPAALEKQIAVLQYIVQQYDDDPDFSTDA